MGVEVRRLWNVSRCRGTCPAEFHGHRIELSTFVSPSISRIEDTLYAGFREKFAGDAISTHFVSLSALSRSRVRMGGEG